MELILGLLQNNNQITTKLEKRDQQLNNLNGLAF